MAALTHKHTARAPPPAFLTPSREALHSALAALQEREQLRRAIISDARMHGYAAVQGGSRSDARRRREGEAEDEWFAVDAGSSRANLDKNRYSDIIAYDRTRCLPPLRTTAGAVSAPDYVNASLVREPDLGFSEDVLPRRWWIAAQAPIPHTVHDFLSLLLSPPSSPAYQETGAGPLPLVNLVVQLTPLVEGRRQKCHPYFPATVGETARVPSEGGERGQGVWVRLERKEESEGARTSELRVGREGDELGRRVVHVEYLGWRDHGVPDSAAHLIRFIHRLHALNASLSPSSSSSSSSSSSPAPILAHCSAGVGRTGTLLALSSLLPLLSYLLRSPSPTSPTSLPPLPTPPDNPTHPLGSYPAHRILSLSASHAVDYVGATVDGLRDQRTTMCQTAEQVRWVWDAARVAWEEGLADEPHAEEE
ncbi:protein-tyrosine phosphatase-like protein [Rhodotorula diobovata]|uniref:Protein-tyrosine phosphatase-like protein n=1 Tax=Rhodotorula diobovata TaxID=5288 RepID=A0A5C5G108_9BASI|nr:protein-tyrosine phosphatase-like protein [Rhodotorula diobovata]